MKSQKGGAVAAILILSVLGFILMYLAIAHVVDQQPKQYLVGSKAISTIPALYLSDPVLNEKWQYVAGKNCDVKIPLPPKEEPYFIPDNSTTAIFAEHDKGGFWELEEKPFDYEKTFYRYMITASFPDHSSTAIAYTPGIVEIWCGPNAQNYSTQNFYDAYIKSFSSGELKGRKSENINLWGKEVIKQTRTESMYNDYDSDYFFATPKSVYKISRYSQSPLKIIHDTTDEIFNNLQFP